MSAPTRPARSERAPRLRGRRCAPRCRAACRGRPSGQHHHGHGRDGADQGRRGSDASRKSRACLAWPAFHSSRRRTSSSRADSRSTWGIARFAAVANRPAVGPVAVVRGCRPWLIGGVFARSTACHRCECGDHDQPGDATWTAAGPAHRAHRPTLGGRCDRSLTCVVLSLMGTFALTSTWRCVSVPEADVGQRARQPSG